MLHLLQTLQVVHCPVAPVTRAQARLLSTSADAIQPGAAGAGEDGDAEDDDEGI